MKYYGKEKCRILKQIRAEIAKNNDIPYVIEECPHQGNCRGTCPKCEQEMRDLERQLEERRRRGLRVAVAGVAATVSLSVLSGCGIGGPTYDGMLEENTPTPAPTEEPYELQGDIGFTPEDSEDTADVGIPFHTQNEFGEELEGLMVPTDPESPGSEGGSL